MADNDLSNNGLLLDILAELRVMRDGQKSLERQISHLSGHKERIDEIEEKVESIKKIVNLLENDQKKRNEIKMAFMSPIIKSAAGIFVSVFIFGAGAMYNSTNQQASHFKIDHN